MQIFEINNDIFVPLQKCCFKEEKLEKDLEEWLEKNPWSLLEGKGLLIIGRQVTTNLGSTIDLLAIDREGDVVVIELKRSEVSREAIAQALEYVSFVQNLSQKELERIFRMYMSTEDLLLSEYHREYFELGEEAIVTFNKDQKLIVVGESTSKGARQIAAFLREKGIDISCVEFKFFQLAPEGREFIMFETVVGEKSHPMNKITSSAPRKLITREEFLESLNDEARHLFEKVLDFAEEKGLLVRWGSVGFTLRVPLENNTEVSILEGYPEWAYFGENVFYVPLSGIQRKIRDGKAIVDFYTRELAKLKSFSATEKGLKSFLKDLRNELDLFLEILSSVIEEIKKSCPA